MNIVVEPRTRRRRGRGALSRKKQAAALFRIWHGVRDMIGAAEHPGDGELVHFLAVAQMLVGEKATNLLGSALLRTVDTSRPN